MTRRTSKGYTYYSCKTYKTKSTKLCSSHTIRNKLIEETVLEAVKAQIALCEKLSETIYAINNALVRQKLVVNLLESKEVVLIKVTGILITCIWIGKWVKSPDNTIIEWKANLSTRIDELKQFIENLKKKGKVKKLHWLLKTHICRHS